MDQDWGDSPRRKLECPLQDRDHFAVALALHPSGDRLHRQTRIPSFNDNVNQASADLQLAGQQGAVDGSYWVHEHGVHRTYVGRWPRVGVPTIALLLPDIDHERADDGLVPRLVGSILDALQGMLRSVALQRTDQRRAQCLAKYCFGRRKCWQDAPSINERSIPE